MPVARHDEVELHYETFGDPGEPTLLLINGLGGQCINYRVEWVERFVAAGFSVIRFACSTPRAWPGPTSSASRWEG
jgi:pimeloyl-ACP methyl ester carboxylesterase